MNIKILQVGELQANCYIISNNGECLVIDPGDESNKIIEQIDALNLKAILITHYHFDHIGALDTLKNKYKINVIDYKNACEHINIGPFLFDVLDTKGHTDDSVSFYFKDNNVMFTGDFLFKDGIGRTDFTNSNYDDMLKSIRFIKSYSDDITIYPGHGESTTLLYEKNNNIFF